MHGNRIRHLYGHPLGPVSDKEWWTAEKVGIMMIFSEVHMSRHIHNTPTIRVPTHFPAATQVIQAASKELVVASENWSYPTGHTFGHPQDKYYAEIWRNGMDWNAVYWVVESRDHYEPDAFPLMIFDDHDERDKISEHDFDELSINLLKVRRDWDEGFGCDFWCHLEKTGKQKPLPEESDSAHRRILTEVTFGHASMQEAKFWVDGASLPYEVEDPRPDR
jgi:hypothetical protein